jgi:hypothetical protein
MGSQLGAKTCGRSTHAKMARPRITLQKDGGWFRSIVATTSWIVQFTVFRKH